MFQTILLWAGGLGIGLFSWLLMMLYTPRWVPARVLSVLAGVVWVAVVWTQQRSGGPVGGFFVIAGVCWVLDVLAGLAMFVVFGGDD